MCVCGSKLLHNSSHAIPWLVKTLDVAQTK